jgi:hypothetical protein
MASLYTLSILAMIALPVSPPDYGEVKKGRHLTMTDTAYAHLTNIAHEARLSLSETVERLVRSTPIWEGSATLADGAFVLIEDYAVSLSSSPDSFSSLSDDEGFAA